MARAVRDSRLESATARGKLPVSGKPAYRSIDAGLHIGYRRGKAGGKWVVRIYLGERDYVVETIGAADDSQPADGANVLSFHQAQARCREIAAERRKPKSEAGPITVGDALDAYLRRLEAEHSKSLADTKSRINGTIRPVFGAMLVSDLTRDKIGQWLKDMATRPRHVRGKAGAESRALAKPKSDDERRRRKSSANRTLTMLRAALNQAFRDGFAESDAAWRAIKPFREVDSARIRYFTRDEVVRLVNAAQGDFRTLVNAALFTGCRYGELCRLYTGDFNPDAGTIFVAKSKSGKARHVVLTDEGQAFFRQVVAGRPTDALMLAKADGFAWGASHQLRPMREACAAAGIKGASFHILRHTAASHLVMAGVPLTIVAQNLGHADSRMTEKHYAHLAPSYVADTLRKFAPTFGTVEPSKVATLDLTKTSRSAS